MNELQDAIKNLEICRLCLNLTVTKISLFTDDFAAMVEILTLLKIKPNDGLPQISCLKCARDVKSAFLVRRRILQSHRAFTNKINRLHLNSGRPNNITNNETTRGSDFHRNFIESDGPTSVVRPIQQLRNILSETEFTHDTSQENDDNNATNENDTQLTVTEEVNENSSSESVEIKLETSLTDSQESNVLEIENLEENTSSQKERIQNFKLDMNIKCVEIINKYKEKLKLNSWRLMNNKDKQNIIQWIAKNNNTDNGKSKSTGKISGKEKLIACSPKKKEPMKLYCCFCQIKFSSKMKYQNHMTRHKLKTCPICSKQVRSTYLKKHLSFHEDSPAMCEICGITCKNPGSLKLHIFNYHESSLSVCEDCGRSFRTKTKLFYHQRKDHAKERKHKCETCGKSFFEKLYLTKHIDMKHMKKRPHICEYCGKGFSGKHALRTHIRQHTNEAPFPCDFCGQRFRQRVSLRGHLKNRHKIAEENKVFCEKCGKGFASSVALDVHSRLHAEIKCPGCSDTFAEKTYLEQHIAVVHPNLNEDNVDDWKNL